jgi:hypothetical protein
MTGSTSGVRRSVLVLPSSGEGATAGVLDQQTCRAVSVVGLS